MDLFSAMYISASGMRAQSERLKIVAQNMANSESTSGVPDGDPYRRKTIRFRNVYDRAIKANVVKVSFGLDNSDFKLKFAPTHVAANKRGYVKLPNVSEIIEAADSREAGNYYKANLGVLSMARDMLSSMIDLLGK